MSEPSSLEEAVEMILMLQPADNHPRLMRKQYTKEEWRLICKGRRLALDKTQQLLKEGIKNGKE